MRLLNSTLLLVQIALVLSFVNSATNTANNAIKLNFFENNRFPPGRYIYQGIDIYSVAVNDSSAPPPPLLLLLADINALSTPMLGLADEYGKHGFAVLALNPFDPKDPIRNMTWSIETALLIAGQVKTMNYTSTQASGYCWGGKVGAALASTKLVNSVVVAHPSQLVLADASFIIQPMLFELPGISDGWSGTPLQTEFAELLSIRGIQFKMTTYPGTRHGWTVTPDSPEKWQAFNDTLGWITARK